MVYFNSERMDRTLAALADPTRRAIVQRLSRGALTISELAAPFEMSLPAVSKHVRVLERAGLLRQERVGRSRRCHLTARPMREAVRWMARYRDFWETSLDALADLIEEEEAG